MLGGRRRGIFRNVRILRTPAFVLPFLPRTALKKN